MGRLIIFALGFFVSFTGLSVKWNHAEETQVELLPGNDYAIKRFAEVVEQAVEAENQSKQEALISYRAKLVIAERNLVAMESKRADAQSATQKEEAPKVIHFRAAHARIDHYKIKIKKLEKDILTAQSRSKSNRRK